ncbi:hypothetical protein ES703_49721 [subsurface metagenome]
MILMARTRLSKWSPGICLALVVCSFTACSLKQDRISRLKEPRDYLKAGEEDMRWWREMKFGLFIHWGPVSLKGTEIGWSRGGERRGRSGTGSIPVEVYDNLYKQFNPIKFDADRWVQIAKDAGMKYLVFTSKHHDGFSMFDSKLTNYKITNSPFKRDVVKELADACHKTGLKGDDIAPRTTLATLSFSTANFVRFAPTMVRSISSGSTAWAAL